MPSYLGTCTLWVVVIGLPEPILLGICVSVSLLIFCAMRFLRIHVEPEAEALCMLRPSLQRCFAGSMAVDLWSWVRSLGLSLGCRCQVVPRVTLKQ